MLLKFTYGARRRTIKSEELDSIPLPSRLEMLRRTVQENESEIVKSLKHVLTERNQSHLPVETSLNSTSTQRRRPALQDITNQQAAGKLEKKAIRIVENRPEDPPSIASSPVVLSSDGTPVIKGNIKDKQPHKKGKQGKARKKQKTRDPAGSPRRITTQKELDMIIKPEDLGGKIWVLRKT